MADVILEAEARPELGSGPAGRYRRAGRVPAVVYGLDTDPEAVTVGALELERILHGEAGANTLINLKIGDGDALALARQIQRHPTRGDLVHVDFVRIRRDVAVQAEVTVQLDGEAPGTREGGMLEQLLFTVTVEAKPGDIPTAIEGDVSELALGDQLRVSDLAVPAGVVLQHEEDELVAQVTVPRGLAEEEAEGEEGEGEGAEGEAEASEGGESGGGDADGGE